MVRIFKRTSKKKKKNPGFGDLLSCWSRISYFNISNKLFNSQKKKKKSLSSFILCLKLNFK